MSLFRSCSRLLALAGVCVFGAAAAEPAFRVLAIAERGGLHQPFVDAAKVWLAKVATEKHFTVDYVEDTTKIDEAFLSQYRLFIMLNFPPYSWKPAAESAFVKYIEEGRGGWIGFHHASLLGDFDGYKMWPWYDNFMGGILFKDYVPKFADGQVKVEDSKHPVMKGVESFKVAHEEWYTYDKSPRPNVHVLASVDEGTYVPANVPKMGDHPVIWTNDRVKARNVYIFMGHHADLFENPAFTKIFRNAILWASEKK